MLRIIRKREQKGKEENLASKSPDSLLFKEDEHRDAALSRARHFLDSSLKRTVTETSTRRKQPACP
jgi:hypothetical protein